MEEVRPGDINLGVVRIYKMAFTTTKLRLPMDRAPIEEKTPRTEPCCSPRFRGQQRRGTSEGATAAFEEGEARIVNGVIKT